MEFFEYFPVWNQLTPQQQETIAANAKLHTIQKGTTLHSGMDCTGLLLVKFGQLRAFILSDEGREITIYRLLCPITPMRLWLPDFLRFCG